MVETKVPKEGKVLLVLQVVKVLLVLPALLDPVLHKVQRVLLVPLVDPVVVGHKVLPDQQTAVKPLKVLQEHKVLRVQLVVLVVVLQEGKVLLEHRVPKVV